MRMSAVVGVVALAAAACGDAPDEEESSGGDASAEEQEDSEPFQACAVLDVGGVDDRSFNQSAWTGMEDAAASGDNIEVDYVESQSDADYVPRSEERRVGSDRRTRWCQTVWIRR